MTGPQGAAGPQGTVGTQGAVRGTGRDRCGWPARDAGRHRGDRSSGGTRCVRHWCSGSSRSSQRLEHRARWVRRAQRGRKAPRAAGCHRGDGRHWWHRSSGHGGSTATRQPGREHRRRGAAGGNGPQGTQGVAGGAGPQGATGGTGPQGAVGTQGSTGAQGAITAGQLLKAVKYGPTSLASYALTTSLAALDGTNLTISFVAPPSGNVIVEAVVHVRQTLTAALSQSYTMLAFVTHGTSTAITLPMRVMGSGGGQSGAGSWIGQFCPLRQLVTGLTPGQLLPVGPGWLLERLSVIDCLRRQQSNWSCHVDRYGGVT